LSLATKWQREKRAATLTELKRKSIFDH